MRWTVAPANPSSVSPRPQRASNHVEAGIIDWWSGVTVADLAMVILSDLFKDTSYKRQILSTDWHEIIGWKEGDPEPDFNILYDFLERHGRKPIKNNWNQIWEKYKDKIYWDEKERCFKVK